MALINILAESTTEINWIKLLNYYSELNLTDIEIFPIPNELGFNKDAIGVSVHQGYTNKENVLSEIKKLMNLFISFQIRCIELYDCIEIGPNNFEGLLDKLLT